MDQKATINAVEPGKRLSLWFCCKGRKGCRSVWKISTLATLSSFIAMTAI